MERGSHAWRGVDGLVRMEVEDERGCEKKSIKQKYWIGHRLMIRVGPTNASNSTNV